MDKVAQGALRLCLGSMVGEVVDDFLKLAEDDPMTRQERRNIRRAARQLPKTPKEVETVAGRGLTPGQIKRRIAIGTGLIATTGVGRRLITNPKAFSGGIKGIKRALAPRELAADMLTGATFYGFAPGAIRGADLEAAKKGKF